MKRINTYSMKCFLLLVLTSIMTCNIYAQVQKGAILVGGSVTFRASNNSDEFSTDLGFVTSEVDRDVLALRPRIGFFTSESLLLGIGLNYEHISFEQRSSLDNSPIEPFVRKENSFLFNPHLTKFSKLTEKLYFTTTVNLLAGFGSRRDSEVDIEEINTFQFRLNVTPGLTYFISDKWASSFTLGQLFYNHTREREANAVGILEDSQDVDNEFGLTVSFDTFRIGFQYFFYNKTDQ